MNKYARAAICVPIGVLKILSIKLMHGASFHGPVISLISPFSEITMDKGAKLQIGKAFKMRDGAKIRVRRGSCCIIGDNTSINSNNMIACHEKVVLGNNIQLSPNVQIYDHDHDFRVNGGITQMKYRTAPVIIGSNVWIGCNSVILKGTTIGNNCIIGAGSVVSGVVPDNTVYYQKREAVIRKYKYGTN